MRVAALPKLILLLAGLDAFYGFGGLVQLIWISPKASPIFFSFALVFALFNLAIAIGLILRWKIAYFFYIFFGVLIIIAGGLGFVLNVWWQLAEEFFAGGVARTFASLLLFAIGVYLYRYFRSPEISTIYLHGKI